MPDEPDFPAIAAALRTTIERQIETTPEGKAFAAQHPRELAKLVTNIVGNLTYTVSNLVEGALEKAAFACGCSSNKCTNIAEHRCKLARALGVHFGKCEWCESKAGAP